ncbi:MAG: HD domain-containing phosphohydrolase [Anaerolineae bacterium]|nr:HD domain-containing phosphohydrolase [Anaerolineae bacterium]
MGTVLQVLLAFVFIGNAVITQRDLFVERSAIITLGVSLTAIAVLLGFYEKMLAAFKSGYLPLLIILETLISITLPLLFTSQLDTTEYSIGFWLMIPSTFIPLSIVGLQYNYFLTFIYSLLVNIVDTLVTVNILIMYGNDMAFVREFLRENHVLPSLLLRFALMVMMGHIVSLLVSSIHNAAAQLSEANAKLEKLNQHLEERVHERTQALETTNQKTLEGWVRLMELRHLEPAGHTTRMMQQAKTFSSKIGLSPIDHEILINAILLHDIGKLGIPDRILLKPEALSEQEFAHSKLHVEYSVQILQGIEFLKPCIQVIAAHHERWNGSGYPRGLRGKDIPFLARVFSVIEVYDVMTHDTVYRKALSRLQTRKHLVENSGILYDPLIVTQFLGLLETQALDQWKIDADHSVIPRSTPKPNPEK